MIIFAVLTPSENLQLEAAITSLFPGNYLKVGPGQYLVAGKGTAADISNALGITDGRHGNAIAIVLSTSSYYGRAGNDVWEWMRVKVSTP
jgi:hypothetical protein